MRAFGCEASARLLLLAMVLAGAVGCRHKPQVAVVPLPSPQQLPVDTTAKGEQPGPLVQEVPLQPTPLPAVTVPRKKKKKVRKPRKVAAPAASPAIPVPAASSGVQVAGAGSPAEANSVGALTPGGSDEPQVRRQATELIAALDKRLAGLPQKIKDEKKDQIVRVINFQHEAQTALAAGDSDGAMTLATKAKLLLDDLLR